MIGDADAVKDEDEGDDESDSWGSEAFMFHFLLQSNGAMSSNSAALQNRPLMSRNVR